MRFTETSVHGAFLIDPEPRGDERGFFARLWCRDEFAAHGLHGGLRAVQRLVQRPSRHAARPALSGGASRRSQARALRRGPVFDVLVDLRPDSPTYTRWFGAELTAENRRMLYVPEGCAHGYSDARGRSEVDYPVSRALRRRTPSAASAGTTRQFGIAWPLAEPLTLSPKDRQWPDYQP